MRTGIAFYSPKFESRSRRYIKHEGQCLLTFLKHFEVHQRDSAACCIDNSLLAVWKCDQTRSLMFKILLKTMYSSGLVKQDGRWKRCFMGKPRALLPYIRYLGICGTEGYGFQPFGSDFGHFRHKWVFLSWIGYVFKNKQKLHCF